MQNFVFHKTPIDGLYLIDVQIHGDARGYFMETYHQGAFRDAGLDYTFVQENQSCSKRGVLRGLHFQKLHPQAKLVRVLSGEVFDVAVDLRAASVTFGQWYGALLSGENRRQLLIPRGFAHGFLVVSAQAVFSYLCDEFYHPEDEGGIRYDDPALDIAWPDAGARILSEKDRALPLLADAGILF